MADVAAESCPISGGLEFPLPSATLSGGFYLSASAPAESGWEGSGLSCACGDADLGLFQAYLWCSNLTDKIYCG